MKKLLMVALLAITAACAQTETSGMMCEKCSCCQNMMGGDMKMEGMKSTMQCPMMKSGMKMDSTKSSMQCPMMQDKNKGGMQCGCCKGMMDGKTKNQSTSTPKRPTAVSAEEHKQHHPEQ
jgi:hypothetical protein